MTIRYCMITSFSTITLDSLKSDMGSKIGMALENRCSLQGGISIASESSSKVAGIPHTIYHAAQSLLCPVPCDQATIGKVFDSIDPAFMV